MGINSGKTKCVKNVCKCSNGTPMKDQACSKNGASMCAKCNAGYAIDKDQLACKPKSCSKGSKLSLKVDQTTGSVVLPSNLTSGAAKNLDCKDNWHKGYLGSIPVECKLGVLRFSGSKKHSCKQYDPCSKDEDDCAGDGHICTHTGPGSHKCSCGSNRYGDGKTSGSKCTTCPSNSGTVAGKANTDRSACVCNKGYLASKDKKSCDKITTPTPTPTPTPTSTPTPTPTPTPAPTSTPTPAPTSTPASSSAVA